MADIPDWKDKLSAWLAENPKTMPDELRKVREGFAHCFPTEKLGEMTLKQYAILLGYCCRPCPPEPLR